MTSVYKIFENAVPFYLKLANTIAFVGHEHFYNMRDLRSKKILRSQPCRYYLRNLAISPDLRYILIIDQNHGACLWNPWRGNVVKFELEYQYTCCDFCPKGRSLAIGCPQKTIAIYDMQTKKTTLIHQAHTKFITCLKYSLDGRLLISGSYDKTVKIFTLDGSQVVQTLKHPLMVSQIAISPDGNYLATSCSGKVIRIWDLRTQKAVHNLIGHQKIVSSIQYSKDGQTLLSSSHDKTIRLWNVAIGVQKLENICEWRASMDLGWANDEKIIVSGYPDKTIRIYKVQKYKSFTARYPSRNKSDC